jgi:hypothetical protein
MLLIIHSAVVQKISGHMVKINRVGICISGYYTQNCVTKSTGISAVFFLA